MAALFRFPLLGFEVLWERFFVAGMIRKPGLLIVGSLYLYGHCGILQFDQEKDSTKHVT